MAKFRKKPVVIDAYQITKNMVLDHLTNKTPLPTGLRLSSASWHEERKEIHYAKFKCITIHGQETDVVIDDWVITEPDGEHHYPCKPDIFAATYEAAE